jgi:UDP:flavonoid glycosyltransferase YjiC (YdhE family)
MKTVLLAAELGEGLGHVAPLNAIAERLVAGGGQDVRAIFCVRDPIKGRAVFSKRSFTMLPSPFTTKVEYISSHSSSYAELLATFGFARKRELQRAVSAWDDIFEVVAPDLMIADHSPTACLAALNRLPVLVTGNGYTAPPAQMPVYPALKAGMAPPGVQRSMLNIVNAVLAERGGEPLQGLPQLMAGDRRAVFALPHLDPYGPLRRDRLLGSYHGGLRPLPAPTAPRVFVYAGASDRYLEAIIQALAEAGVPISAYLGGAESATSMFLKNRGATVHDTPPVLEVVLAEASMVVSHGGSGLTQAALKIGRPQVIVPIHAESQITAGRVEELGVGLAVRKFSRKTLKEALTQVLEVRLFQERAQETAVNIDRLGLPADPVGEAVTLCRELLDRG